VVVWTHVASQFPASLIDLMEKVEEDQEAEKIDRDELVMGDDDDNDDDTD